ncbi:MAG: hypothetical protein WA364_17685 [Candidatus Nitrosopolaris sp.]
METYLGEDRDSQEALELLCLTEGAEVTHYEAQRQKASRISSSPQS